ncbi:MAG TPA: response regulator [Longimicrobiales bacterium]
MPPERRILWVDDEVDLLEPHLFFLRERGYTVETSANGSDALDLIREKPYDLVLLDEQMPGQSGLQVLSELRREDPHARVVMVTKSEEDRTLMEAIGRRVDDYLVKPASPMQVLSVVTRVLQGAQLRQQQAAQDFAGRYLQLQQLRDEARDWRDFASLYDELTNWDIRLRDAGDTGLAESVEELLVDVRREFSRYIQERYTDWVTGRDDDRPPLSVDIAERWLVRRADAGRVLFMVVDCLRLDQWRALTPLIAPLFDIHEELYYSILPTATPYSRNALFSGKYPDGIAADHPTWWRQEEGSMNAFEDELLREQLRRGGRNVPVHYEKVFTDEGGDDVVARVAGAFKTGGVVATVFNFIDLLTHGRSESAILMEVARDESALRALTRQWFERSTAFRVLELAAREGVPVVFTTDHGSILCRRPVTVFARRDATANLRYKFGNDLRAEDPKAVFSVNDERALRFPEGPMATNYLLALEDTFFVYPTKLREYQNRYRGSFLHGGVSPEEMILPIAVLTPRGAR